MPSEREENHFSIHEQQGPALRNPLLWVLLITCLPGYSQDVLVRPYLQPGNAPTLSREEKILIWQTDSVPAEYDVEYISGEFLPDKKPESAKISSESLILNNKTTILYRARLSRLQFDDVYTYRVCLDGKTLFENTFSTRTKLPVTRFVVFGDCGQGTPEQAQIAYQVYEQQPQFVITTGDNVYSNGRESEYKTKFFPYYGAEEATKETGAPLMGSIPFYMVVGNHDVRGADLDKYPDGLAYFYYNDLPLNAPVLKHTAEASGDPQRVKAFRKITSPRFPRITNYSFDYGNVHIVCLDANDYIDPLNSVLVEWLRNDLTRTKADWKIVAFHQPGFNSSKAHYDYQLMRLLSPVLEQLQVDLVLNGHVHNYQRTMPLKFAPKTNLQGTQYIVSPEGRVDGTFTLDQKFDGITDTTPEGIIYIVTGAGGAALYDPEFTNNPDLWKHEPQENWVPFTARMISNTNSFTLIETKERTLNLKQLNAQGTMLDEITITK